MADYTTNTVTVTRREWRLSTEPYAAAIVELQKATAAALQQYREDFDTEPHHDDWLRVRAEDDVIVLFYEVKL